MDVAVLNNSGVLISQGQVVYQTGFVQPQQLPSVALASASNVITAKVLGLAVDDIDVDAIGTVRVSGIISGLDTSTFLENAIVYLSDTLGGISNAPGTIEVIVGHVVKVSVDGCIQISCSLTTDCPSSKFLTLVFTHNNGVPGSGTRYLRTGQGVLCSSAGIRIDPIVTITVATAQINAIDASRNFNIEILSSPSSSPTVIAILPLASGNISIGGIFSVALTAGIEIGVRVVRISGSGASTFNEINVMVLME